MCDVTFNATYPYISMFRVREKCTSEGEKKLLFFKYLIPSIPPISKISSDKSFIVLTLLSQIIVQHTIRHTLHTGREKIQIQLHHLG